MLNVSNEMKHVFNAMREGILVIDTDGVIVFGNEAYHRFLNREGGGEDIGEITLIGLCTDICVISNALLIKAFLPETPITVDAACCAGVTPQSHINALSAMKMCQIRIINE